LRASTGKFVSLVLLVFTAAFAFVSNPARADNAISSSTRIPVFSSIGSASSDGGAGVLAVNVASGNLNMQANVGAMAIDANSGAALASVDLMQSRPGMDKAINLEAAYAEVTGAAFANRSGWTAVNQISGVFNSQANTVVIGVSSNGVAVSDSDLSLVAPRVVPATAGTAAASGSANDTGTRGTLIGSKVFDGATGIVQANVTAGVNNTMANRFGLEIQGNSP
jgi:hypothetical protein